MSSTFSTRPARTARCAAPAGRAAAQAQGGEAVELYASCYERQVDAAVLLQRL